MKSYGTLHDLRFAWRRIRRRPRFAALMLGTLALGIGAATAVFSVVDGTMFKPLPYPDSERLVAVWRTVPERQVVNWPLSYLDYAVLRDNQDGAARFAAYNWGGAVLQRELVAEQRTAIWASASFLSLTGIVPALGRGFLPEDEGPGRARVVMLGHDFWQSVLGADPDIIGRSVTLDGSAHTVIGTLPPDARLPGILARLPDFWLPAGTHAMDADRTNWRYSVLASLEPGATAERVEAMIVRALESSWTGPPMGARVESLRSAIADPVRGQMWLLMGAAGLLLVLTCGTAVTLLLGESSRRDGEVAIRAALGANVPRLGRQLLTEHLLLAGVGAIAGVALASALTQLLVGYAPPGTPRLEEIRLGIRGVAFALTASAGIAGLFGLTSLVTLVRARPHRAPRTSGTRVTGGRGVLERGAVAVQVMVALVLLQGAGVLTKSFAQLTSVDPGFEPAGLYVVRLAVPGDRYPTAAAQRALFQESAEALASLPGVRGVSWGSGLPFVHGTARTLMTVEDVPVAADAELRLQFAAVTPGLLELLRIPLRSGRMLGPADGEGASRVALVNEAMVRRFWPETGPLGKRIGVDGELWEVVGVVGNTHIIGLDVAPEPIVYLPAGQSQRVFGSSLVVRWQGNAPPPLDVVRERLAQVDRSVPVTNLQAVAARIELTVAPDRFRMVVVGLFAVVAGFLALGGVYGVTTEAVQRRFRELAVRVALGASVNQVIGLTVRRALFAVAVGLAVGLVVAALARGFVTPFLYDVVLMDAPVLIGVVGGIVTAAALAAWLPARRAGRVDPAIVLREE